ncbi:hypothetical protein EB795_16220 [Pseudomonas mandelii]|nr:hypothetical protein [Pseudomonas mandelii]
MWQVVASVQQTVALLSTEQPFEQAAPRVSRKKGRDVASFDGVLEALTGQTFLICTFIVRRHIFGCVLVRCFVLKVGRRVTLWRIAINLKDLR